MIKFFTKLLALAVMLAVTPACQNSRSISVVKRHYSKGHYISFNKHPISTKKEAAIKKNEGSVLPNSIETVPDNNQAVVASNDDLAGMTYLPLSSSATSTIDMADKPTIRNEKLHEPHRATIFDKVGSQQKGKKIDQLKQRLNIKPNSEARSLFWLVITILLIIWLIAILSGGWGLGGLVNLLLLIALILFILWLIRLI